MWDSIRKPGDCVTIFTPVDGTTSGGVFIRWRWLSEKGIRGGTRSFFTGFEIEEAVYACLEVAGGFIGPCPRGIEIFLEDAAFLSRNGYRISGGSLGLPLLIGLLGYALGTPWPRGTLAWGALTPTRNNSYAVQPVDNVAGKLAVASEVGALTIICPDGESIGDQARVNVVEIARPIEEALPQLRDLLID